MAADSAALRRFKSACAAAGAAMASSRRLLAAMISLARSTILARSAISSARRERAADCGRLRSKVIFLSCELLVYADAPAGVRQVAPSKITTSLSVVSKKCRPRAAV